MYLNECKAPVKRRNLIPHLEATLRTKAAILWSNFLPGPHPRKLTILVTSLRAVAEHFFTC